MKRILAIILVLTMATALGVTGSSAASDDIVYPVGMAVPKDPDLKNLQWNRYVAGKFTVMSIDDAQGRWLAANLGSIKTWCVTRWGFPDLEFDAECRVMCVPTQKLMKKLFNLTESKYEIRPKERLTVLWLVLDDKPAYTIPTPLTHVCVAEFEARHHVKMPWAAQRGMALLNGSMPQIKQQVVSLNTTKNIFTSEKMLTTSSEAYDKMSVEDRRIFDAQATALMLLLRKEFGEAKLQGFLRLSGRNKPEGVVQTVYGFRSFGHFDNSYARYMRDLSGEVLQARTPESYLNIKPVK